MRSKGLTIVELMMTLLVLSLLTAMALPSFKQMMERNAVTSMANDLLADILLARSEAIKRESEVVIRRLGGRGGRWHIQGWRVFEDQGANGKCTYNSGADSIIADRYEWNFQTNHPGIEIKGRNRVNYCIVFSPRGRGKGYKYRDIRSNKDYLVIKKGQSKRYICFSAIGRPRVEEEPCT